MKEKNNETRNGLIGGAALIIIGTLLFLAQLDLGFEFGYLILPILSIIFFAWGILSREAGLMIPGGILGGIGLGIFLIDAPLPLLSELDEGGIFMLSFALGWVSIVLFSALFAKETHWWPLIPAGILALIGFGVLFGGIFIATLELLSTGWPVILILLGVWILFSQRTAKTPKM